MSLRRHLSTRCPSQLLRATASHPPSSRPPLLFLYPRCLQTAAAAASARPREQARPSWQNLPEQKKVQKTGKGNRKLKGSKPKVEDPFAYDDEHRPLSRQKPQPNPLESSSEEEVVEFYIEKLLKFGSGHLETEERSNHTKTPFAEALAKDADFIKRVQCVPPQRIEKYLRSRQRKDELTREKIDAFRKTKLSVVGGERSKSVRLSAAVNWQKIVEYLISNTSPTAPGVPVRGLKIKIPWRLAPTLLYSPDYNMLQLQRWFGCKIRPVEKTKHGLRTLPEPIEAYRYDDRSSLQVGSRPDHERAEILKQEDFAEAVESKSDEREPAEGLRYVMIYGPSRNVERAAAVIMKLIQLPRAELPVLPEEGRIYSIPPPLEPEEYPPMRADEIPKPKVWTSITLADYVKQLTGTKISSHLHPRLYPEESHIEVVDSILHEIFSKYFYRQHLTRAAFHDAMRFWSKRNDVKHLQEALGRMDEYGIQVTAESVNILLNSFAVRNDSEMLKYVIDVMMEREIPPDAFTWVALMQAAPKLSLKLQMFSVMREYGLILHRRTLRACVRTFFPELMEWHVAQAKPYKQLIQEMDAKLNPLWLEHSAANQVLDVLSSRNYLLDCVGFAEIMASRQLRPDHVSINVVLANCKALLNPQGASEWLRVMAELGNRRVDSVTYGILFAMALRQRLYNVARVAWRYACLDEATTSEMRHVMLRFYSRSQMDISYAVALIRFISGAGAPPMGVIPTTQDASEESAAIEPVRTIPALPALDAHPSRATGGARVVPGGDGVVHTEDTASLKRLQAGILDTIQLDLDVSQQWAASIPLDEMLSHALRLDEEVKQLGLKGQHRFDWLYNHGLEIRLHQKGDANKTFVWT